MKFSKMVLLPLFAGLLALTNSALALETIWVGDSYTDQSDLDQVLGFDFGKVLQDPKCLKRYLQSSWVGIRESTGGKVVKIDVAQAVFSRAIRSKSKETLFVAQYRTPALEFNITYNQRGGENNSLNDLVYCDLNR